LRSAKARVGRPEETRTAGIGSVRAFRRGRRAPATRLHRRLSDQSAKPRNVLFLFEGCLTHCDGVFADVRLQQTLERRAESSSPRGRLRGIDARRLERGACGPDRRACGFAHRDGRPCRLALGSDDGAGRLAPEKLAAIVSRRGQSAPKAPWLKSSEVTFPTTRPKISLGEASKSTSFAKRRHERASLPRRPSLESSRASLSSQQSSRRVETSSAKMAQAFTIEPETFWNEPANAHSGVTPMTTDSPPSSSSKTTPRPPSPWSSSCARSGCPPDKVAKAVVRSEYRWQGSVLQIKVPRRWHQPSPSRPPSDEAASMPCLGIRAFRTRISRPGSRRSPFRPPRSGASGRMSASTGLAPRCYSYTAS
jgi:hypothetical protein